MAVTRHPGAGHLALDDAVKGVAYVGDRRCRVGGGHVAVGSVVDQDLGAEGGGVAVGFIGRGADRWDPRRTPGGRPRRSSTWSWIRLSVTARQLVLRLYAAWAGGTPPHLRKS